MSNDYRNYIFVIIILVITIPVSLAFFLGMRRRGNNAKKSMAVTGGNISVFFDRSGNVTIIPYIKDKYGNGKATSKVEKLKSPYSGNMLGNAVKRSLNGCKNGEPCSNAQLLDILGVRDWKQFSEDKRNISVYYREGYGLVFNTTTRQPEGAYSFNTTGMEHSLPPGTEDGILGNTILQLLVKCR